MIKLSRKTCKAFLLIMLCATFFSIQSYANESKLWSYAVNNRSISGVVMDNDGVPLPGCSVVLKGTVIGVQTDKNGKFSIDVPDDASVLIFSYVGYLSQEVTIGNKTNIEVKLVADFQSLSEVVVVGYGTQSKAVITSSMASVSSSVLKDRPVLSFNEALVGKVAGVQFQQTTGAPGGGFSVKIRGVNSITSTTQPLYVIDGVPIDDAISLQGAFAGQQAQNPMASINPNDIQSIDILKDAASTAIYGSRGSNGVILITTKQGSIGKATLSVNVSRGIQAVSRKVDMMNVKEYVAMETQRRNYQWKLYGSPAVQNRQFTDPNSVRVNNGFKIPLEFSDLSNFRGTDWQNELFQIAPMTSAQLSLSGGTNKTRYYLSGDFVNQDGIVINTGYKKFSLRSNVDAEISDKIKIGFKVNPSYNVSTMGKIGGYDGAVQRILTLAPTFDAYNADGTYSYYGPTFNYGDGTQDKYTFNGDPGGNPVVIANLSHKVFDQIRLLSSAYLSVDIIKHLTFRSSISTDVNVFSYNEFNPSNAQAPGYSAANGSLYSATNMSWVNENILTYTNTFKEKHNVSLMGGFTAQKSYYESHSMWASDFPNDNIITLGAGVIKGGDQYRAERSMLSYLGRVSYDFDKKYLFSATFRADGSSRFGAENRWGTFPSASVGWRVAQESFMENVKSVSELKLRASYGIAGNDNIGEYRYLGLVGKSNYILGSGTGVQVNGLVQNTVSNQKLGWEQTKQFDIGMELGLFKNKVYLNADYYNSLTTGILFDVPVPLVTGFGSSLLNIGSVRNKGVELSIETKNVAKKSFQWNTSFNISFNRNNVESIDGITNAPIIDGPRNFFNELAYITKIGKPIGSFYGFVYEGVYKTQAEADADPTIYFEGTNGRAAAGDMKYKDISGPDGAPDGKIDGYDQTVIGHSNPDFIWGLTNTLTYKSFDLGLTLQGVQGSTVLLGHMRTQYRQFSGEVRNYWKSEAEPGDGNVPNPGGSNQNRRVSKYWLRDGSFLRIKNLSLGYNLPAKLLGSVVSKARVYVTAENLVTFTKYPLFNPEVNSGEGDNYNQKTPGMDFGGYPLARTITFGFNVTF